MFNNIPQQLKELNNWLCYDDRDKDYFINLSDEEKGRERKRPRDLKGVALKQWQNKGYSFNECVESIKKGFNSGLGLVLKNNGVIVIDYDKCLKDIEVNDKLGYIKPIFKDADTEANILSDINLLKSYIEISPSNKGLHIVLLSDIKDLFIREPIEIYSYKKYIRFSGNSIFDFDLDYNNEELEQIINKYKIDKTDAKPLKFNDSIFKLFLDKNFKYKNSYTDKQILETMFNSEIGEYLKKLYYNELSDAEYSNYKKEKASEQLKKGIINQDYYNKSVNNIDLTNSGKSFTLIMYLIDFCYGDIQAVKRLFSKSALCKDDYLKPKYLVDNSKYKIDKADYMIKRAIVGTKDSKGNVINQYKNFRL